MPQPEPKESLSPVATPPPLRVESDAFEGTLVTLFHLARDGRVDLSDIPLYPVCAAYLEYLMESAGEDVDAAGAALLALAYLVERKAWALLPIADPPPPQDLPELPEPTAHEFARAVDMLEEWHKERGRLFFRSADADTDVYELPFEIGNVQPKDLARALERMLLKARPIEVEPIARKRPSLAELMKTVMSKVRDCGGEVTIDRMMPETYTRLDVVFVFLAVLELLRVGRLAARTEEGEVLFSSKS